LTVTLISRHRPTPRDAVVCVDVGSTFTKATVVDVTCGDLLATGSHPTTIRTDVLDGVDALLAELAAILPGTDLSAVRACSSAGGGLRLAVVGYERVVTAEAGHRVGLSAGARVVHVSAGPLDTAALAAASPDVVLLAGGTDGGNAEILLHNARELAVAALAAPIVVAGNVDARGEVYDLLTAAGKTALPTANVLPRIGVLDPAPARRTIREVFLRHVIGGKGLSVGPRFAAMVHGATPDLVLTGVELLADGAGGIPGTGDVVVIDIGGATTDVYSVVTPDPEEAALRREVVEVLWRSRTVEGDLGMRWSALGVVAAARAERLPVPDALDAAAARRTADPGYLPQSRTEQDHDDQLAALAATVALRRHARPERGEIRSGGKDLRQVQLVIGSGGVLRHADSARRDAVLHAGLTDHAGGWLLPERAAATVDAHYVLAAAGLLADDHPIAAARLLRAHLGDTLRTGR